MKLPKLPISLVFVFLFLASSCERRLSPEQYAKAWTAVMKAYERTTASLPEPVVAQDASPAEIRAAVAKALRESAQLIDVVGAKQDALRPPSNFEELHRRSSRFFRMEAELFREYASAVENNTSREEVKAVLAELHGPEIEAIKKEAARLGVGDK